MVFTCRTISLLSIARNCYYKHTAFSWGCYGRLPHEGKNITLWRKNITRDEPRVCFKYTKWTYLYRWPQNIIPETLRVHLFCQMHARTKQMIKDVDRKVSMLHKLVMVFTCRTISLLSIARNCYYKHTAFSWGCYGRLPHEGKNITLLVCPMC
jgi:hypothetical protein